MGAPIGALFVIRWSSFMPSLNGLNGLNDLVCWPKVLSILPEQLISSCLNRNWLLAMIAIGIIHFIY
ncbi:MAG: hypothetical protein B7X64_09200 [Halothiobacillus sp. 39-53-45]|nr:MAG: hypothetical protein B7X64_09200 [Halothiobacillus sp. 39-53-45]